MMTNPSSSRAALLFIFSYFIIVALLHVVESSSASPSNSSSSSITIGSSLSVNGTTTSYWLSHSGIFAFGFYPIPSGYRQYQVGIWINKGSSCGGGGGGGGGGGRTLVWSTADGVVSDDQSSSSILLNQDGVFVLQQPGNTISKPLFRGAPPTASYASMNDSGNFVVYDASSNIIWQSFDYPTDTIISGQTLKSGYNLRSNNSCKLTICVKRTLIMECTTEDPDEAIRYRKCRPSALNLDVTGHLYLVDNDGSVTKSLTPRDEHGNSGSVGNTIYRATLGSDKVFRLYGEKIGSECGKTVELWHSGCSICNAHNSFVKLLLTGIVSVVWMAILIILGLKNPNGCMGVSQRFTLSMAGGFGIVGMCLVVAAVITYFVQIRPYY